MQSLHSALVCSGIVFNVLGVLMPASYSAEYVYSFISLSCLHELHYMHYSYSACMLTLHSFLHECTNSVYILVLVNYSLIEHVL